MRYTYEQKQATLERIQTNGGNVAEAARHTNIPYDTVLRWHHAALAATQPDPQAAPPDGDVLTQLESKLGENALKLANKLLDEKSPAATLTQRTNALGSLVDRLLKFEKLRDEREGSGGQTKYIVRRVIYEEADGIEYDEPSWEREGDDTPGEGETPPQNA